MLKYVILTFCRTCKIKVNGDRQKDMYWNIFKSLGMKSNILKFRDENQIHEK